MCPWCLCLSVQYVVILNHSQLFSILRWWYTVRVCVCLSAFLSHPSHHRTIQSRTEAEAETSISPAWELVRSSERAKITKQSSHKDVGTRLREHEIIELRATLLFSERRETHSSFRRILQRGEIEFAARAHCLFESGGSSKVHTRA